MHVVANLQALHDGEGGTMLYPNPSTGQQSDSRHQRPLRLVESYGPVNGGARTLTSPYAICFVAGVLGSVLMSVIMVLGHVTRLSQLSLEMMLGTLLTGRLDAGTWVIGFLWHLVNGGLCGLVYAAIFKWVGRSGPMLGAQIGVAHWLAGGIILGALSAINPFIPALMPPTGFFGAFLGAVTVFQFLVMHMVFGATVGTLYRSREQITIAEHLDHQQDQQAGTYKRAA